MAVTSGYAAYQQNKIMTATPAELTLMLYEGAIKFCNIALTAIDEKDYAKVNHNIQRAENIITELRSTLNFKYPVAKDFENVYEFIFEQMVQANIKKDKEILNSVLEDLRGMRDTWKEVMAKTKHNK